jgi:hypothetical protein
MLSERACTTVRSAFFVELDEALVLWIFRHALGSVCRARGVCRRWRAILPSGRRMLVPDAAEAELPAGMEAELRRATEWDRVLLLSIGGPSPLPFLLRVLHGRFDRVVSLAVGGCADCWADQRQALLDRVICECTELEELTLTDVGLAQGGGAEALAAALRGSNREGLAGEDDGQRQNWRTGGADKEDTPTPAHTRPEVHPDFVLLERNGLSGGMLPLAKTIALLHLRTLELGGNRLGSTGASALACALLKAPSRSLSVLGLAENDLGPEGMCALQPALCGLQSLVHLNLNANRLMAAGASHLADALRALTTLTSLELNFNFLEEQGTRSLAPVLGAQPSLTTLDLGFNDMGPEGIHALVEGLANDKHVGFVRLDLSKNSLGTVGAHALLPLLGRNATTLEYVCLKFNGLGQQHAAKVNCLAPGARVEVLEL